MALAMCLAPVPGPAPSAAEIDAAGEIAASARIDASGASPAVVALGAALFSDPRLSPDGRFSCASCHRPDAAFAEPGVARQRGRDGKLLATNAPSLLGLARRGPFRHDGAAPTLAAQIAVPLLAANEMANPSLAAVAARLAADRATVSDFEAAFGGGPTEARVVAALGAYLRSLTPEPSPFDRFQAGDPAALSPAARRGLTLFRGRAGCSACHLVDGDFRDGRFHDTGIAARRMRRPFPDGVRPSQGRIAVTGAAVDRFRVRTPGLRAVARTPPYMHDGSIRTLADVVRYYAAGGAAHAGLSPLIIPFAVDEGDVADLVAFLEALGETPTVPVSAAPAE
ncbi:cytochrome c peroxidase [Pseudoxanthobacter sp. M-2]|uniref:cytochrome-c peroxidase n=1 Tax=Pseudoxanthobacter sp. M-2 TaxID=3078754 RepID=UPI0038FC4C3B